MMGNLHTHSVFCDGKSTPEELCHEAIKQGFSYLGFSGHAYTPFDLAYAMSPEKTEEYILEIIQLKEKYSGKLKIFCGIERDLFSVDNNKYDYEIGSVHYIKVGNSFYSIDSDADIQKQTVEEVFDGDVNAYAETYFRQVAMLDAPIIGHIDLIMKYNEKLKLFDENSPRYIKAATEAIDALIGKKAVFEVNTGAMARGMRSVPYPSEKLLKIIKHRGGRVIVTSDCHDAKKLNYAFDKAYALLHKCGYENTDIANAEELVIQ